MSVDYREGEVWRVKDVVKIGDCVEDGDGVAEGCYETGYHLGRDSKWDIALWIRDLFCEMGNAVWCSYCVCTVQHTGTEDEAVAGISSLV